MSEDGSASMFAMRRPHLLHLRSPCDEHRCLHPRPPRDAHSHGFNPLTLSSARTFPTLVLDLGCSPHLPCSLTLRCSDTSSFGARLRRRSRFRDRLAAFMFALASNGPPLGGVVHARHASVLRSSGVHGRLRLSTLSSCPPSSAHDRCLIFRSVGVVPAFSVPASFSPFGEEKTFAFRFPPSSVHPLWPCPCPPCGVHGLVHFR